MRLAVLIPVKRFTAAKGRLAGVLTDAERARLARWMASGVVEAVAELPTFVACDDDAVADWARECGATVIWGPTLGLNGAVDDGVAQIAAQGFDHVLVSHADLPRPSGLLDIVTADCITLVPDRRHDGTNLMSFPTRTWVRASYGGGSFARHLDAALGFDIDVEVRSDPDLSLDLDTPRDLIHPLIRPLVQPLVQSLIRPLNREVLPSWLPTNPANH